MYNRISIVGGSGTGKSTLCDILAKKLNLPAIHLDAINFEANWVEIDKNKRDKIINERANEDKWIIDGNYSKTLKERFDRADLIIWLDYSTYAQVKGIFNFTFFKYVITYNKKKRHIIVDNLNGIPEDKVLIFKKRKALNKWLEELR